MVILKAGTIPSQRRYKSTCSYCNTLFTFHGREGSIYGNTIRVWCPFCGLAIEQDVKDYIKPSNPPGDE